MRALRLPGGAPAPGRRPPLRERGRLLLATDEHRLFTDWVASPCGLATDGFPSALLRTGTGHLQSEGRGCGREVKGGGDRGGEPRIWPQMSTDGLRLGCGGMSSMGKAGQPQEGTLRNLPGAPTDRTAKHTPMQVGLASSDWPRLSVSDSLTEPKSRQPWPLLLRHRQRR